MIKIQVMIAKFLHKKEKGLIIFNKKNNLRNKYLLVQEKVF
jgi:hypothetical protein